MPAADGTLESVDAEWSISTRPTAGGRVCVEVRRNGRRRGQLGKDGLTDAQARRYTGSLVRRFASGKLQLPERSVLRRRHRNPDHHRLPE